jgi:surfeit locus 1 family protein
MPHEAARGRLRTGLIVPTLFALTALIAFLGLGTWQVQRKAWKEALIETLQQRLSAAPTELPPRARWSQLDQANDEFRRVRLTAAFIPRTEALIYAGASAMRSDVSGPGYWVFAPAQLTSGGVVVVNRGFVPEGRQAPGARPDSEGTGGTVMVGVLRWPEPRGLFTPADQPGSNLWFVRDPVAIAAARGWGEVAPFFIELESPQPPGGLPRAGPLTVKLRNEHLQYALTWYGLALVVAVMFGFWLCHRAARGSSGSL